MPMEVRSPIRCWQGGQVTLADSSKCQPIGSTLLEFQLHGKTFKHPFLLMEPLLHPCILGMDFLSRAGVNLDLKKGRLSWDPQTPCPKPRTNPVPSSELEAVVGAISVPLAKSQKVALTALLREHHDLFSDQPGRTDIIQHKINTGESPPIASKPRRHPPKKREKIRSHVEQMLKEGVIEPSTSSWASPVVIVGKKTGDERFCVDYRRLNQVTADDRYPLPLINNILDRIAGHRYMTTLDLTSGYWQVAMSPKDKEKTAFTTEEGLFQFRVMPFGLKTAPATFQRLMDKVLQPVLGKCCQVYLDDIIIYSHTFEQHLQDLARVFTLLQAAGLTVKLRKCEFLRQELGYLGYVLTPQGLRTTKEKVQAIAEFPSPTSTRQLSRFLGLCAWYSHFIRDFSTIAEPLYALRRKRTKWAWSPECGQAFQTLKDRLVRAPVLQAPRVDVPYHLYTDASSVGLGAVLAQKPPGEQEYVIAYASRTLNPAERNYTATELECLAVVWALEKFKPQVDGSPVTVHTDHAALQWLQKSEKLTGRLMRWALRLQEFTYQVVHRKGHENELPDALSRDPITQKDSPTPDLPEEAMGPKLAVIMGGQREAILRALGHDSYIREVYHYLTTGTTPTDPARASAVYGLSKDYVLIDDLLYYRRHPAKNGALRPYVPFDARASLLSDMHDSPISGHGGVYKTYNRLLQRAYWPGMKSDVVKYVRGCRVCQQTKHSNQPPAGHMQSTVTNRPMELLGIDLMGPYPRTRHQHRYLLVVVDYFTKWVELAPLRQATAQSVAKVLVEQVFCRYGLPESVVSDNGPQFIANTMDLALQSLGVKHTFTTPYHPQSNLTERVNRDIGRMIAAYVGQNHKTWDQHLQLFALALRTARHETTGEEPARLVLCYPPALPWDRLTAPAPNEPQVTDPLDRTQHLQNMYRAVQHRIAHAQAKQRQTYNKRRVDRPLHSGQYVWLRTHPLSNAARGIVSKFSPKWAGPYKIVKKYNPLVYDLRTPDGRVKVGRHNRVNLKPYHPPHQLQTHPEPSAPAPPASCPQAGPSTSPAHEYPWPAPQTPEQPSETQSPSPLIEEMLEATGTEDQASSSTSGQPIVELVDEPEYPEEDSPRYFLRPRPRDNIETPVIDPPSTEMPASIDPPATDTPGRGGTRYSLRQQPRVDYRRLAGLRPCRTAQDDPTMALVACRSVPPPSTPHQFHHHRQLYLLPED